MQDFSAEDCRAKESVLRISLATFLFFIIVSLLTIGIDSTEHWRGNFQTGFWLGKVIIWLLLIGGFFFVPTGTCLGPRIHPQLHSHKAQHNWRAPSLFPLYTQRALLLHLRSTSQSCRTAPVRRHL